MSVSIKERGWAAHMQWSKAEFHRNTLLSYEGTYIVVSTVGRIYRRGRSLMPLNSEGDTYDTKVFYVDTLYSVDVNDSCGEIIIPARPTHPVSDVSINRFHDDVCEDISHRMITLGLRNET